MREEEEMSEDEIKRQMEQNEFYKFKKTIKNVPKQELARYNSRINKEQMDEEEVES
jgi:hypothetical protein